MSSKRGRARHPVFRAPILIGIVSLAALVAGLLGAGVYDGLAWAGLAVPVGVIAWALRQRD